MIAFENPRTLRRVRGFSLVEIIITITVIGIIASIAVGGFGDITGRSKDTIARNLTETLNQATRNFSHANWDLRFNAVANSAGDEIMVLRSLQWREPDGAAYQKEVYYKGPYMRDDWNPDTSSSTDDWRIQWTGSSWKLLLPDEAGAGLKVDFEGRDLGKQFVFPDNFTPVGSR
ncbi:MAG: prepilin-type N-terminal cleavage/methylation domain-containing protein [Verrucomicrobiae bacterium]|nr:prepilin-type N-terminal cleavage/methylation domain-containing protein [Verrucomicrobiae bacterium]